MQWQIYSHVGQVSIWLLNVYFLIILGWKLINNEIKKKLIGLSIVNNSRNHFNYKKIKIANEFWIFRPIN